jgi:hypothetical protein
LPPSFLEQHALTIGVAAFLGILLCAVIIWLAFRPKAAVETPPDELARHDLQALRDRPPDSQLLTKVSHVIRRYLARSFGLPAEEMTTSEFCRALEQQPKAGSALAVRAATALRAWDEQKFSPAPSPAVQDPLREAGTIIDAGQARIAELQRQELAPATPESAGPQKG